MKIHLLYIREYCDPCEDGDQVWIYGAYMNIDEANKKKSELEVDFENCNTINGQEVEEGTSIEAWIDTMEVIE